ncbi:MAG: hypothetical protein WAN36_11145, partial [Calditrichia bacterium]
MNLSFIKLFLSVLFCTLFVSPAVQAQSDQTPPVWPPENVQDEYHGVTVSDPYRGLENWNDPKVQDWSEAQNSYA